MGDCWSPSPLAILRSSVAGVSRETGFSIPVPTAPAEDPEGPCAGLDSKDCISASVGSAAEGLMGIGIGLAFAKSMVSPWPCTSSRVRPFAWVTCAIAGPPLKHPKTARASNGLIGLLCVVNRTKAQAGVDSQTRPHPGTCTCNQNAAGGACLRPAPSMGCAMRIPQPPWLLRSLRQDW
jgi:hypothetical protein